MSSFLAPSVSMKCCVLCLVLSCLSWHSNLSGGAAVRRLFQGLLGLLFVIYIARQDAVISALGWTYQLAKYVYVKYGGELSLCWFKVQPGKRNGEMWIKTARQVLPPGKWHWNDWSVHRPPWWPCHSIVCHAKDPSGRPEARTIRQTGRTGKVVVLGRVLERGQQWTTCSFHSCLPESQSMASEWMTQ